MGSCAGIHLGERASFYQQFALHEKIGQGSYGKVYLAKDKRSQKISAVKVQAAQFGKEWVILDEVIVWRALGRHPNVVSFHDLRQEANVYFILMEVCPRALSDRVMSAPKWTATELMHDFTQALLGVQHMHMRRIVHRDIKVQNFLYGGSDGRTLKLADFGLSVEIHPGEKLEAVCGSPAFMAPEMVLRQGYDLKIDMWSLGVTFFMVMHGTLLVGKPKMSVSEMKEAIKSPTATKSSMMNAMVKAEALTGELKELTLSALDVVRQLTVRDPLQRPGTREALQLPFMRLAPQCTWEQKLRYEQVLLVDRPPAPKKKPEKAVTHQVEPSEAGRLPKPKPQTVTDLSPVVPNGDQSRGRRGDSEPSESNPKRLPVPSKLGFVDPQSSLESRKGLQLPQDLSFESPRRGGPDQPTSSLRVKRYKSLGDVGSRRAQSSELGPGLAESNDSIRVSVAAALMQAYRGGSRRLIDSGMPSMSRGMMSPDTSWALGGFAESSGQPSDNDALRRFAEGLNVAPSSSPMAGPTRSGPNGLLAEPNSSLFVEGRQLSPQAGGMHRVARPDSSLPEEEPAPSPAAKLPGLVASFASPST